ncbi:SHOCT domain-containing protein [Streptacidiphilus melanogenes]|uniref:SHOCT domain-containing protein n=1 Tax=Streptacidiphilus melanogenes TaxID=411235 RepID=UPI001269A14B|nr:SHOCT domain-containing protein [Streptacidiphilus melanogenes]
MNLLVWIWFGLMSAAFMPLCLLASQVPGPNAVHIVLYVFIIGVLWWGSFGYGMYLSMAGMGGGDRRLLKRGIRGTARILAVKGTNTYINGQPDLGYAGRRVYRYTLHVELPGRQPYETYVSVASHQFQEGQTVQVAAAPHNHKRVAIDPAASATAAQVQREAARWQAHAQHRPQQRPAPQRKLPQPMVPQDAVPQDAVPRQSRHEGSGHGGKAGHGDEGERLRQLSELGRLHKEGVLSDEEFATEKARILGFSS